MTAPFRRCRCATWCLAELTDADDLIVTAVGEILRDHLHGDRQPKVEQLALELVGAV